MLKLNNIKPYIKLAITAVLTVLIVMLIYMTIHADFTFTTDKLIRAGVALLVEIVLIVMWLDEGETKGQKDEGYKSNKILIGTELKNVNENNLYGKLDEYCELCTKENIKDECIRLCERKSISYMRYLADAEYRASLTQKELAEIRKAEKKATKTALRVKPSEITSCAKHVKQRTDLRKTETATAVIKIAIKLVWSALSIVIGTVVSYEQTRTFAEGLTELFFWLSLIATTIYFSLNTGYNLIVETRNDYFLRLIDFFKRFNAWSKVSHNLVTNTETNTAENK